jgi:hypothetical protein
MAPPLGRTDRTRLLAPTPTPLSVAVVVAAVAVTVVAAVVVVVVAVAVVAMLGSHNAHLLQWACGWRLWTGPTRR